MAAIVLLCYYKMLAIYNWDVVQALRGSRSQPLLSALRSPGQATRQQAVLPNRNTEARILQCPTPRGSAEQKKTHHLKLVTLGDPQSSLSFHRDGV